jgi:RND family efflux transporter MFP subunit
MRTRSRLWQTNAALLIVGLTAMGCRQVEIADEPPPVRPVKLMTIGEAGNLGIRSFPGRVEATNQVDLSFRVGGPLIELPVREGALVKRGHLAARIDPRDFRIRLDSARADHDRTQADFQRYSALYEKEAVSEAQLDQARAARDMAKAALEDAEANLEDTNLRIPFTGRVGETFVENFQDVRAKEPILSLVDVDRVDIVVDAPESLVARIAGGLDTQDVEGFVAGFDTAPGREFDLELKEAAAQADPRTQTYRITFTMTQPDGVNILPGMTAQVKRGLGMLQGDLPVVVPAVAIFADEAGQSHVWVFDAETRKVHQRPVTLGGLVGSDRIRVDEGLEIDETIAVTAVTHLWEGQEVRPLSELEGYGQ